MIARYGKEDDDFDLISCLFFFKLVSVGETTEEVVI